MIQQFYPDEWLDSAYVIDYEKLYKEGYRGLIFDIDNTLVPHGAPADERAIALFKRLREIGFSCCLLSNNKEPRVKMFNEKIGVSYIFKAGNILVKPINPKEEIQIVLKRRLEWIILYFYKKTMKK